MKKAIVIVGILVILVGAAKMMPQRINATDVRLNMAVFLPVDRETGKELKVTIHTPCCDIADGLTLPYTVINPFEGPCRVAWVDLQPRPFQISCPGYKSEVVTAVCYRVGNSINDNVQQIKMRKLSSTESEY